VYAAALRSASAVDHFLVKTVVFGWFADDEFKRAQRAWHGARLSRSDATVEEMAQEFERLAEHLEAVQGLCSNDRLRTICGDAFDGLATDFDGLLAVNLFGCEVARRFSRNTLPHREVRRLLLEGDLGTLDAVLAEADEHTLTGLRSFLTALADTDLNFDEETELQDVHRAYL
jgi:hypothetical protein